MGKVHTSLTNRVPFNKTSFNGPSKLSIDDNQEGEFVHVPGGGSVVAHQVQSPRHVRVAVVTAQVVLHVSVHVQWRVE